jgi:ADP-ribosylglycohydrolase
MAQQHIVGCILGTAVGDALGLPFEGLTRRRATKLFAPPDRHQFFRGRGMVSDDTELTCLVAQALIASGGNVDLFRYDLARRFKYWLLSMPAGMGLATLRATLRLWIGFRPDRSGVFSAGNGPAIRAAILGAAIDDRQTLRELIRASSRISHTDSKAEHGAVAVALAAKLSRIREFIPADQFSVQLKLFLTGEGDEIMSLVTAAVSSVKKGELTHVFADSLGLTKRVSGYVYHSVPVALHAWMTHPQDYRQAVMSVIRCGGDTDSMAAIVGGIVGTAVGKPGIPNEWLQGIWESPRSIAWMQRLAVQLDSCVKSGMKERPLTLPLWQLLPRNILFLMIVLYHGCRRLLPPY